MARRLFRRPKRPGELSVILIPRHKVKINAGVHAPITVSRKEKSVINGMGLTEDWSSGGLSSTDEFFFIKES
jgi:hypothetical protein